MLLFFQVWNFITSVGSTNPHEFAFILASCGSWETERSRPPSLSLSERNKRAASAKKSSACTRGKRTKLESEWPEYQWGHSSLACRISRAQKEIETTTVAARSSGSAAQCRTFGRCGGLHTDERANMLPHSTTFSKTNKGWMRNEPHTLHAGYHLLPLIAASKLLP